MKTKEPKKDCGRRYGKKLGGFNIRFVFYTNGLTITPDDNVEPSLAKEIIKTVRGVLFDHLRIERKLPRLNPFRVSRVTRGCTTNVFAIFYDGVWEKNWGVFPTIKDTQAFIDSHQDVFEKQKKNEELFSIVKGVVRFSQ